MLTPIARRVSTMRSGPTFRRGARTRSALVALERGDADRESTLMADDQLTDADLAELTDLVAEAASALISGDVRRYVTLVKHADDFTLMAPTGGQTVHGFVNSEENLVELERFFKGGDATLEVVQTYASGNLAVLVLVERQHGTVGDHPDQDWSLRVTLVFRREGSEWRLAHRHADALVHPITFDQLAELARG
jgi:ketosteroid isomerase-like protein